MEIVCVVSLREGIQIRDEEVANWLRKSVDPKKVVLLVNKCEGLHRDHRGNVLASVAESHKLGFGEPVPISAETGEGLSDLYERLQPLVDKAVEETSSSSEDCISHFSLCKSISKKALHNSQ